MAVLQQQTTTLTEAGNHNLVYSRVLQIVMITTSQHSLEIYSELYSLIVRAVDACYCQGISTNCLA